MSEVTTVDPFPAPPPGGWTVDDLDALPVSKRRYELTDGALTVSPSASNLHEMAIHGLLNALDPVLPDSYQLAGTVEIRFARQLTRILDAMVIRSAEPARHWFRPDEVVLAVEVESPASHVEDRITKPALYAQFGIPHFWRLEPDRRWITRYALDGRTYREVAAGARLLATEPVAVDVAVADLLPRWAR